LPYIIRYLCPRNLGWELESATLRSVGDKFYR
jgi:hypothetical protein